jgi:hypothetical protein
VKAIQSCINEAVVAGSVTPAKPINIAQWKTRCYTNIPQQEDGYVSLPKLLLAKIRLQNSHLHCSHSCGAYTLKYMLAWDGDEMTENFRQVREKLLDFICTHECSMNLTLI